MKPASIDFIARSDTALADTALGQRMAALCDVMPSRRDASVAALPDYELVREQVRAIKQHTLEHLEHYLDQFTAQAEAQGTQVHRAASAADLNRTVLDICRRHAARKVLKGKSMITEETDLNAALLAAGLKVIETDLGEYIIQQAGETPSHIVGPALHKSPDSIRELFLAKHPLGERELPDAGSMVSEARQVLRKHFLSGDVGIIGANALIAETGASMLVTNEGNGDLVATLPPVLIVCASIEKLVPRPEDATRQLRLLVRSTLGQPTTAYTSFYAGPRRDDESDGPLETHVVLLDNGRSEMLDGPYESMLHCLRCGACLQHCPIYESVGGHAYGWVYPGPMGSVLTPLLLGLEAAPDLPDACTGCGRCAEICPASIPLPDLLRELRTEAMDRGLRPGRWRFSLRVHAWLAARPRLYHLVANLGSHVLALLGGRRRSLRRLPFAAAWSDVRDFPAPEGGSFLHAWQRQQRQRREQRLQTAKHDRHGR